MFGGQIGTFVRTVYTLGSPMIGEFSDQAEEKTAKEAAELALGDDVNWNDEAMKRLADYMIGTGERLRYKLEVGDADAIKPVE